MRKQELVHLHALCVLVRKHVESRAGDTDDAFYRYEEVDVSPTAIYRAKGAHRRAVLQLTADISAALPDEPTPPTARPLPDGGPEEPDDSR